MIVSDLLQAALDVVRPIERLKPSEFAVKYRKLKPGTTARSGAWSHEGFEFLVPIVDAEQEAIEAGLRFVFMKPAQIGGSEAMINNAAWVQTYYPGPSLYLTSKDDVAKEFSRDRIGYLCETCEPLARKHLAGKAHGELIQTKRFTDGKLTISGGKSVLNFQSQPYRNVRIDEADSLADELRGHGDPIKLADLRTAAYAMFGTTSLAAFAHPSERDHGVGKLYYELSDQRRGFVPCPHCTAWFWLQWDHVKVLARADQSRAEAERDPSCYVYVTPCCAVELTDGYRLAAARRSEQRSTLPPEVAKTKTWVGVHTSHLYTKPLAELAAHWIQGIDSPSVRRVFVNKILGDVYNDATTRVTVEVWDALVLEEDVPGSFVLGTVPHEVQWLTAGQDSGIHELHWAVWGWGYVRSEGGVPMLCGWLIDAGVEAGPAKLDASRTTLNASDLGVFSQLIYERRWPGVSGERHLPVDLGLHDSGWQPIGAYEFCRMTNADAKRQRRAPRAFPSKGMAHDSRSRAPAITWGAPPRYRIGDHDVYDPDMKPAHLNTFALKLDWLGLPEQRFATARGVRRPLLVLPRGIPDGFTDHLASEHLATERGKKVWTAHGPNHWLDCSILAFAAALNLRPLAAAKPRGEAPAVPAKTKKSPEQPGQAPRRRASGPHDVNTSY